MNICADPGETRYNTVCRALEYAKGYNDDITVTHNDITVSVYPQSYVHDILEKMHYLQEYMRLRK